MKVLLDTTNLFHSVRQRYGKSCRLDYDKLLVRWKEADTVIAYVAAYDSCKGFIDSLTDRGMVVKTQKPREHHVAGRPYMRTDFTCEMTLDALRTKPKYLVVGTSDIRILPLLRHFHREGVQLTVHAVGIPQDFRPFAECVEIGENLLV